MKIRSEGSVGNQDISSWLSSKPKQELTMKVIPIVQSPQSQDPEYLNYQILKTIFYWSI